MNTDFVSHYPTHINSIRKRFDHALAQTGLDRVVIHSGHLHEHFLDDTHAPFKVNPHFNTWLPVTDNPDCFIVYAAGQTPVLLFNQPEDFWHKPPATPDAFWTTHFDIRFITEAADVFKHLPRPLDTTAFIGEADARFDQNNTGASNPAALLHLLHYERAYKTDYELACQRAANRIGARGHLAATRAFREGASEFDMLLAFVHATQHTQHDLPYGAIIALNEHAATLHYSLFDREPPQHRHSLLIDAGTSINGYASDITRTHAAHNGEFAHLIDALDEHQQALVQAARPGADYRELHLQAHHRIAQLLNQFDFIRMTPEAIVATGLSGHFFPHGLGHLIGLQVHDIGGFQKDPAGHPIAPPQGHPFLRLTRTIEPRQTLTIEPGLYFIEPLLKKLHAGPQRRNINWGKIDHFRPCGGIRIEDDILVTQNEPENMTRNAFATAHKP